MNSEEYKEFCKSVTDRFLEGYNAPVNKKIEKAFRELIESTFCLQPNNNECTGLIPEAHCEDTLCINDSCECRYDCRIYAYPLDYYLEE